MSVGGQPKGWIHVRRLRGVRPVHANVQQVSGNLNHHLTKVFSSNQNRKCITLPPAHSVNSKCMLNLVINNYQNATAPWCIWLAVLSHQRPAPDVLEGADLTARKFPTEHQYSTSLGFNFEY